MAYGSRVIILRCSELLSLTNPWSARGQCGNQTGIAPDFLKSTPSFTWQLETWLNARFVSSTRSLLTAFVHCKDRINIEFNKTSRTHKPRSILAAEPLPLPHGCLAGWYLNGPTKLQFLTRDNTAPHFWGVVSNVYQKSNLLFQGFDKRRTKSLKTKSNRARCVPLPRSQRKARRSNRCKTHQNIHTVYPLYLFQLPARAFACFIRDEYAKMFRLVQAFCAVWFQTPAQLSSAESVRLPE